MNDDINISNDRDLIEDTEGHGRWRPAPAADEAVEDTEGHGRIRF